MDLLPLLLGALNREHVELQPALVWYDGFAACKLPNCRTQCWAPKQLDKLTGGKAGLDSDRIYMYTVEDY